ncbi:MAG: hypothetical protein BGO31_05825 [Bacteroidetes bacterium 43-16]|nr:MAG: hypothetical protein BGO31_05825 [Bacteroidetes bacterium 43-16]
MKKYLLLCALGFIAFNNDINAQIQYGGLPASLQQKLAFGTIPVSSYQNPDWAAFLEEESGTAISEKFNHAVRVGLHVATGFSFPQSGQLQVAADGTRVWRGVIHIEGAPAIGLMFDQFQLPEGVRLFASNENGRQVVGAFDHRNVQASGKFLIDAIQGDKVYLELDIAAGVKEDAIKLNIDKALVFHRAIEHLRQFVTEGNGIPIDQYDTTYNGRSSVCTINAICPQGTDYEKNRRATVSTINFGIGGGGCSGTLINNTGNTTQDCKPYILTATHCQGTGTLLNSDFDNVLVRFNFERPDCQGTGNTNAVSMNGVNVVARADYNTSWTTDELIGDFMLYELRQAIPASYGAVLSGWNRSNGIEESVNAPRKFIGFHHPMSDNKKLSTSQSVVSRMNTSPYNIDPDGSRWFTQTEVGYVSPGSSGSGLFDGDGRLIGIASTAGTTFDVPVECSVNHRGQDVYAMDIVWYYKLWHGWEFSLHGTDSKRRLQPWLDPANTGVTTINSVTSSCEAISEIGIKNASNSLYEAVAIYPNPSTDGKVYLQYNLKEAENLDITVYDLSGNIVLTAKIARALNGIKTLNLEHAAMGMYFVKIATKQGFATQKLFIGK